MITSICPKCGMRYEASLPVQCPCVMMSVSVTSVWLAPYQVERAVTTACPPPGRASNDYVWVKE